MAKQDQVKSRFISFLVKRIEENVDGIPGEAAEQIRLHLDELRAVVTGEEDA